MLQPLAISSLTNCPLVIIVFHPYFNIYYLSWGLGQLFYCFLGQVRDSKRCQYIKELYMRFVRLVCLIQTALIGGPLSAAGSTNFIARTCVKDRMIHGESIDCKGLHQKDVQEPKEDLSFRSMDDCLYHLESNGFAPTAPYTAIFNQKWTRKLGHSWHTCIPTGLFTMLPELTLF